MKPNLLKHPLRLPNGTVLRNRLAKAAMSETLGTYDNRPTPDLVQLYRRWAGSGLGLIITGNVMIDRRALGEPGNVAIEDEADLPVLRQWAQAVTGQGAAIWAQLNHPGKQSTKGLNAYNLAPSAVPFRGTRLKLSARIAGLVHGLMVGTQESFRLWQTMMRIGFGIVLHGGRRAADAASRQPEHPKAWAEFADELSDFEALDASHLAAFEALAASLAAVDRGGRQQLWERIAGNTR